MLQGLPEDLYLEVDGFHTRYWLMGEEGSVLLLLHGLGGYVEHWGRNIKALSRGHRVYALDLLGFGRTDKPSVDYTLDRLADFILKFMETLGIGQATLVGNSMGGALAMLVAIQEPDKVSKLVLVDALGLGREVVHLPRLMLLPGLGELLTRPSRTGVKKVVELSFVDAACIPSEFVDLAFEMTSLPGAQDSLLSALRATGSFSNGIQRHLVARFRDALPKIQAPTLVVWGREDRVFPVRQAVRAVTQFPNARLLVMDRAGHVPMLELPKVFNQAVLEFLEQP